MSKQESNGGRLRATRSLINLQHILTGAFAVATAIMLALAKTPSGRLLFLAALLLTPVLVFANTRDFKRLAQAERPGWPRLSRLLKRATESAIVLCVALGAYASRGDFQ